MAGYFFILFLKNIVIKLIELSFDRCEMGDWWWKTGTKRGQGDHTFTLWFSCYCLLPSFNCRSVSEEAFFCQLFLDLANYRSAFLFIRFYWRFYIFVCVQLKRRLIEFRWRVSLNGGDRVANDLRQGVLSCVSIESASLIRHKRFPIWIEIDCFVHGIVKNYMPIAFSRARH